MTNNYFYFQRPIGQFLTRFCVSPPPPCLTDRSLYWSTTPVSWTLMWSGGTSDRNWSGWTREWGERTWLYMSGESMCLRIPSGNSSDVPLMNGNTDSTLCLRVQSLTIFLTVSIHFWDFHSQCICKNTSDVKVHMMICIYRWRGSRCWRPSERVVHHHFPGNLQPDVCSVQNFTGRQGHLHNKPVLPL